MVEKYTVLRSYAPAWISFRVKSWNLRVCLSLLSVSFRVLITWKKYDFGIYDAPLIELNVFEPQCRNFGKQFSLFWKYYNLMDYTASWPFWTNRDLKPGTHTNQTTSKNKFIVISSKMTMRAIMLRKQPRHMDFSHASSIALFFKNSTENNWRG